MLEIGKAIFGHLMRSETPLPLSKIQEEMGTHFDTLKHHLTYIQLAQGMPKVTVTKVGRQIIVETEKTSEDLEFLKEIIGEELPNHVYLLIDLHNAGATTFEKAVSLSMFPSELKILDDQAKQQRVIITTDSRVYLTQLGVGIAKGAKRYTSLAGVGRKIPRAMSFQILPSKPTGKSRFTFTKTAEPKFEISAPKVRTRVEGGEVIIEIHLKKSEMPPIHEEGKL